MVREKQFYKKFFSMFIVLVLQNVITLSVNLADNMMLGAYAEVSLSGVAAVNQVQFMYQMILVAFGDSMVVLGSQYFGKKDYGPLKQVGTLATKFGLLASVIVFVVMSCFPAQVLTIFTTDQAIIAEGVRYAAVIRWTYFFFAITQMLLATLRCTGVVNIALYLSIMSLVINVCINYTLIYGHFGAPRLGVVGAAIGTLIARVVETIVVILYIKYKEKYLHLHLRDYLRAADRMLRKDYVRVMLPILFIKGIWGLNSNVQNAILGHMTARAIAANSVASTLYLLVKSMAQGSAAAALFMVGEMIGQGKEEKELKYYAKTFQILFVLVGIAAGLLLFGIRVPILSLYKLEPETRIMANSFLVLLAFIEVTMSYQMPSIDGIVMGGGDTKWVMRTNFLSAWAVAMPLAAIMAFVFNASPVLVVLCLNADQIFKCVPAFFKVNKGHWAKKLTR